MLYIVSMKTMLIRDIDEGVHIKFKTICVAQGKSMSEVIRDFMESTVGTAKGPLFPAGTSKNEDTISIEDK